MSNSIVVRLPDGVYSKLGVTDEGLEDFYSFVYFSTTSPGNFSKFVEVMKQSIHNGYGVYNGWHQTEISHPTLLVDYNAMTVTYDSGTRNLTHIPSKLNPLPPWIDDLEVGWSETVEAGINESSDGSLVVDPPEGKKHNLVSSRTRGGKQKVVLDLDFDASLIPSSTPGHYHLFLDKAISTSDMEIFVKACHHAGLIADGNFNQWRFNEAMFVRPPWKLKKQKRV